MKMLSDMELEMVAGGNDKVEKTFDAITNSGVLDYAADKVCEAFRVLEYIIFR